MERRLTAILYADVAGYSRLVGADEEGTLPFFRSCFDALTATIEAQGGRVVNTAGDAVLAEFASVVTALACAVQAQRDLAVRNEPLPAERKLQFRIGVNLGDVILDRGAIYGNGVNLAARLATLAEPGGICVSGHVLDEVEKKVEVGFAFLGLKQVKNIEKPVRAYKVLLAPEDAGKVLGARKAPSAVRRALKPSAALLGLIGVALVWFNPLEFDLSQHLADKREEAPVPSARSIAVLPFTNTSGEAEQDYFAAGLTDDLITELSKIRGVFVIARNSAFMFKDTSASPQKVAEELGVRYILQGTWRRAGPRVRINVQLIDSRSRMNIWAERYDRDYSDFFALQDEVVDRITSSMSIKLADDEKSNISRIPTSNLEAYDYFMRAEQEGFYFGDVDAYRRALSFYQKALDLDPNFADAYAGIAWIAVDVWRNDYNLLWPAAVARKIAYDTAGEALRLDPQSARAYVVLGLLQMADGHHAEAVESIRTAAGLLPNDAQVNANLGFVLAYAGLPGEAVAAVEKALRLEPRPAPNMQLLAGVTFYTAQQYKTAVPLLEMARDALPAAESAREYLAAAYALDGDLRSAQQEVQWLLELFPTTNLRYYETLYDHWRHEDRAHHLRGLQAAGIPTWPFGFVGRDEDRLDHAALVRLTTGTTWVGRHKNGTTFIQQFDRAGNTAYRSDNTFLTGTSHAQEGMLCQQFDGYVLDRTLCGYVYRSFLPDEAPEEYVQVSPDALKFFSVRQ